MSDALRFYHLISVIERQHGLTQLDVPSRALLDLIVMREMNAERSTARDLIEASGMARAVVYRKLTVLKTGRWIKEHWQDFKLCYATADQFEALTGSLRDRISKT